MQAPGSGSGGAEGHDSNQRGASSAHGSRDRAYEAAVSRVVQIAEGPWPFGEIVLVISRTRLQLHEFTLRVPFGSPIEAQVAQRSLTLVRENLDHHTEFIVDGGLLTVRWVDPDRDRLQSIFNHFLEDLSLLLRTMRRFGPPFPPMSLLGKGG